MAQALRDIVADRPAGAWDERRPAAAASLVQDLAAEWVPLARLGEFEAPWAALARRAATPNVFYEPAFALAAAPVFGRDTGAVLVWSSEARTRLLGFFPGRVASRRYGLPWRVLVGWTHPYAPLGTPLVDRERTQAVIAGWLAFVARDPGLPGRVLLPFIPQNSAFAQALAAAVGDVGARDARFARHSRALLLPRSTSTGPIARALAGKKRKELRRQMRRLAGERGSRLESTEGEGWAEALTEYQQLEAGGWKGRAGTAIAQNAAVRGFVDRAIGSLAQAGQARIHRLRVGERTVAAAITLRSGSAGWFWKIAYDEAAARASPGVQLALELTRNLDADAALAHIDSCATADHPMINHLWRGRLDLADHLIAVGPKSVRSFALACGLEHARRFAERAVKRMLRAPRLNPARAARGG